MRTNRGALWLALFAGQAAWLLDLELGYMLVYVACAGGARHTALTLTTAGALALAAIGLLVSWRAWSLARAMDEASIGTLATREFRQEQEEQQGQHSDRFLALAGIALNAMAMLLIVGMAVPRVMLDPCSR